VEHAVGALLRPFQPQLQHKQGSDGDPSRSSVKVSGAENGSVAPTRRSLGGKSFFRGGGAGGTARVAAGDGTDPAIKDGGEDEEGRRRERQLQTLRRASIQYLKNMATRDEAPDDRGPAPADRATATPPAAPAAAAEATAAPSRAATKAP